MDQEFFINLPLEIIVNILSRLPVRTIISCKCICKSWLNLVETNDFAKFHLSNSVPGLAIHEYGLQLESYKVFKFEDELDLDPHELHYNVVTNFGLPFNGRIHSSANGLLFLHDLGNRGLYLCNPITRDYIAIHCPREFDDQTYHQLAIYGFGVSKMSGLYKVVRIYQDSTDFPKLECHVYTLGTESWRRVESGTHTRYDGRSAGVFVNGNLHWMMFDQSGVPLISCFNLETDLFSTPFHPPHLRCGRHSVGLFALEGCLCICDNSSSYKIDIWLMKEYGVEKSWIKEFVISKVPDFVGKCYEVVYPIKVFKDGDILMAWEDSFLFYYSSKTKTSRKIGMFEPESYIDAVIHIPSFHSLKSFIMKNVRSF